MGAGDDFVRAGFASGSRGQHLQHNSVRRNWSAYVDHIGRYLVPRLKLAKSRPARASAAAARIGATIANGNLEMNRKVFWAMFVLTQFLGSLGAGTGSPHGNPLGLILMMVFLFPGSIVCWYVFEGIGLPPVGNMTTRIILTSFVINLACWYVFGLVVSRVRGKKTH